MDFSHSTQRQEPEGDLHIFWLSNLTNAYHLSELSVLRWHETRFECFGQT